jgi:carboxylate-amine ligase
VQPWLPVLLALSVSSPYWMGVDSGYASSRTLAWQRWPTAGPAGPFATAAEYDEAVADLVRVGAMHDAGMIYFDVRPSAHVPTVELRVCDACPNLEDVILLTGIFRALVIKEREAASAGVPAPVVRPALARAATWRAARYGLEGSLVTPLDPVPVPARTIVGRLLDELRPILVALGDWPLVAELAEAALARGSSSARQRAAFAVRGELADVVDQALRETANGMDLP